ncbi:MAG: hypothetical protein NTX15_09870 [Candidatus Kapabacteria bacterium]|nr:hypothetical protein [Candidatus Kapabacteria bacterium]
MRIHHCYKIIVIAILATTCMYAQQPTYELKLGRKMKEFDRYLLKTTYESSTRTKLYINGNLQGDSLEKFTVVLNAQCEIVSVTVDGQEKEKRLVIRDFRKLTSHDTVDLLPNGTKIRCWFSDSGSVYTINDAPTSDALSAVLVEVVKGEGGSRTGSVLDAKKPVAVGASWKMNIPAFRKVLGPAMSKLMKKINGTVTFASIDTTGPLKTATVVAKAEAPNFTLYFGDFPSKASLVAEFCIVVPLDNRYPQEGVTTTSTQLIDTKQGAARMEMVISSSRTAQFIR